MHETGKGDLELRLLRPFRVFVLIVVATMTGLSAQTPRPTFEVASIKKIDKAPVLKGFPAPAIRGGTVSLLATNVAALVQMAYGVRDFQVVGGPDWVRNDLFEVQARAAGEPAREAVLLMLQSMLEDRFGLRLRKEQREMRFFAMVPARSDSSLGPYLHRGPDTGPCTSTQELPAEKTRPKPAQGSAMAMVFFSCGSLSILAELASRNVELPVFDRTGLAGRWSATLYFAPDPTLRTGNQFAPPPGAGTVAVDPNLATFTSALQEQLGLRLEATRGPVDVMVIDAVRQPTEN